MTVFEHTLTYLGWRGQALDSELRARIEAAVAECEAIASPRHVWREFPLNGDALTGTAIALRGRSAGLLLRDASGAAVMAATLGAMVDSAISRYSRFDLSYAVLLDAAASALIEQRCDEACREIADYARRRGLASLPRFSPGYGDLPLDLQPAVLAALDAQRRLGLTATEEHLLIPRKSVTAFIALVPLDRVPQLIESACAGCDGGTDCPYPSCIKHNTNIR